MVDLELHPVTPDRASDLLQFAAAHGKFGWCACMRWRLTSSEFKRSTKPSRLAELRSRASGAVPVGVLAYAAGEPIGWCSVAPRHSYSALERSKALARIDERPVWSVACFFVDRRFRRQGVTLALLKAAVAYALQQGAVAVEGYPVEPSEGLYRYMGSPATFREAGFEDVTPSERSRLVMRYTRQ